MVMLGKSHREALVSKAIFMHGLIGPYLVLFPSGYGVGVLQEGY